MSTEDHPVSCSRETLGNSASGAYRRSYPACSDDAQQGPDTGHVTAGRTEFASEADQSLRHSQPTTVGLPGWSLTNY